MNSINNDLNKTNNDPIIIGGPCSAESEEQLLSTAKQLSDNGTINVLRAGIWKPRTRPGSFEGVGSVGLKWLAQAKSETGLKTAVEVANVKHVYEALKHGVDILWIGARTTVNPFAVQEIAEALEGVNIPILIKNPVNPDLALWEGAIERMLKSGVEKVGVIHRGFSKFGDSNYRNPPQWQLPIELKRRLPDLTMICDPSHICGNRDGLLKVSQKALDLNFDGLMIESHINPKKALSDASQQITPHQLKELVDQLVVREIEQSIDETTVELEILRNKINIIDEELIDLLANRMQLSDEIGLFKKKKKMTILQSNRWDEILAKSVEDGESKGLKKDFIVKLLSVVHLESINRQHQVMNSNAWLNKILKKT